MLELASDLKKGDVFAAGFAGKQRGPPFSRAVAEERELREGLRASTIPCPHPHPRSLVLVPPCLWHRVLGFRAGETGKI